MTIIKKIDDFLLDFDRARDPRDLWKEVKDARDRPEHEWEIGLEDSVAFCDGDGLIAREAPVEFIRFTLEEWITRSNSVVRGIGHLFLLVSARLTGLLAGRKLT